MGIATKSGDNGMTGLADGSKVSKAGLRIEVLGALDEFNSFLGLARSLMKDKKIASYIKNIQAGLFGLGSDLAKGRSKTKDRRSGLDIKYVERLIDKYESRLGRLKGFAIVGDSLPSAVLDVSRAICRRLERRIVVLKEKGGFKNNAALAYVNRLSDLLYIFARYV